MQWNRDIFMDFKYDFQIQNGYTFPIVINKKLNPSLKINKKQILDMVMKNIIRKSEKAEFRIGKKQILFDIKHFPEDF